MMVLGDLAAVDANVFLRAHPKTADHSMRKDAIEQALLAELSVLAGSARIRGLEEELRPLHAAMPKNEHGKLEPSVVRYVLHRYFAQKHGWHMKGLERAGGSWNSSSPTNIMKDQAPSYIQSLFEQRLHGQGLGLQELAVFAATLSDLIRKQAVGEVEYIYNALGWPTSYRSDQKRFEENVLRFYLVAYTHGIEEGGSTLEDLKESDTFLIEYLVNWPDVKLWAKDLRHTFDLTQQSRRNPFEAGVTFERAVELVEEIAHRFGSFHNLECHAIKDKMVELEHQGTGRVRLYDFYSNSDDPDWPFHESVEYLRTLGALDETDPHRPSVGIPNYVGSLSHCSTPSDFYSVCCLDECEGLMARVELKIAEPLAKPEHIAEVVSGLGSDTVDAPRNLSTVQLKRLQEIAEHHGGHVPLHGRLFAQWMHHAYPRECPFPHAAGDTNPLSPDDWLDELGFDTISASDDEIMQHTLRHARLAAGTPELEVESLPWTAVEELVASHTFASASGEPRTASSPVRVSALLAVLAIAALSAVRVSKFAWRYPTERKVQWHLV